MNKKYIKLSESQFNKFITESVLTVLNELGMKANKSILNEISIIDKYQIETQTGKNKHPHDLFTQLCFLDPTTNENKVGKYANWLLQKYNPNTDLNALKRCMDRYADGIKRNILQRYGISTDINSFKSYDELISTMNNIMKNDDSDMSASEYNNRQKLEGQFKVLGSTSTYSIVQPLTFEAERYFGSGTEWCTVANNEYFERYTDRGPLFILYPKDGNNKKKMQIHFESNSFADYEDNVYGDALVCMEYVLHNKEEMVELTELCKNIWKDKADYFITFEDYLQIALERLANGEDPKNVFDDVNYCNNGLVIVKLKNKWNFINQKKEILRPDQWFDWVDNFREGFARVELGNKYNFIKQDGKILCKEWFDNVYEFCEGFACVELNDKGCNFINQKGDYLSPNQWFDKVDFFYEGIARVYLKGKGCNFINQKGEILRPDQWFDETKSFNGKFAYVFLNGNWHKMDKEGKLFEY